MACLIGGAVGSYEYELLDPPADSRGRELWIQHAAGFILTEDVRRYATDRIDSSLPEDVREAVLKGIDDALYGLMQVIDGVSGVLSNSDHRVELKVVAEQNRSDENRSTAYELDLRDGDGMCTGYHGWVQGDFGEDPVAKRR